MLNHEDEWIGNISGCKLFWKKEGESFSIFLMFSLAEFQFKIVFVAEQQSGIFSLPSIFKNNKNISLKNIVPHMLQSFFKGYRLL